MKVNKANSGSWADRASGFLIFDSSSELKARHKRRGVYPRAFGEIILKTCWIARGERLITSVLALQNKVCCRSELSFSTGSLNLSTVFLATD
jgi:hypothetical protein